MTLLYAVLVPGTILACEIALRLPLPRVLGTLRHMPGKAARVIRSPRISDDWKEKVLPLYAARIMTASLGLLACLVAIALPVLLLTALVTGGLGSASAALLRLPVLAEMLLLSIAYIFLRRRFGVSRAKH